MQHYILLSRNLLYTGLTRAKKLAILVGPTKALGLAVNRVMDRQRYTALADRLKDLNPAHVPPLKISTLSGDFRERKVAEPSQEYGQKQARCYSLITRSF